MILSTNRKQLHKGNPWCVYYGGEYSGTDSCTQSDRCQIPPPPPRHTCTLSFAVLSLTNNNPHFYLKLSAWCQFKSWFRHGKQCLPCVHDLKKNIDIRQVAFCRKIQHWDMVWSYVSHDVVRSLEFFQTSQLFPGSACGLSIDKNIWERASSVHTLATPRQRYESQEAQLRRMTLRKMPISLSWNSQQIIRSIPSWSSG